MASNINIEEGAGAGKETIEGEEEDQVQEKGKISVEVREDGWVIIQCPLKVESHKNAVHGCNPDGKPSETWVRFRSCSGETSVVECRPITGRTHQIRLHLQVLRDSGGVW